MIEVIGVAGSGKTTICRALTERCREVEVGIRLSRLRYVPRLAVHALKCSPTILAHDLRQGRDNWRQARLRIYLDTLHGVTRQVVRTSTRTILFDQGPLFLLSVLYSSGNESSLSAIGNRWWRATLKRWSATLDVVIWLDAPDDLLIDRIRSRARNHRCKTSTPEETRHFLANFRSRYQDILSRLAKYGGARAISVDTSRLSVDKVAEHIVSECRLCSTQPQRI